VCGAGAPIDVAFESFMPVLDGVFSPVEDQRRQPILDALPSFDSDVLCIGELPRQSDKLLFANALAPTYPNAFFVQQDETAVPDDPTDIDGNVPTPPSTPPCASSTTKMDALLSCLESKCSTVPGSDQGSLSAGNCIQSECTASSISLLFGSADDKRCFDGVLYGTFDSSTYATIRTAVTTDPLSGLAFGGQNTVFLASRYPFDETKLVTLPATGWRVSVLFARVHLPNDSTIDVYCNDLQTSYRATTTQPYVGAYGAGPSMDAWTNENRLEGIKLRNLVASLSGASPAIVMGEFFQGPSYTSGAETILSGVAEPSFDEMTAVLGLGVPIGYVPQCTSCTTNPMDEIMGENFWTEHVFLNAVSQGDARGVTMTHTDPVVPISPTGAGGASGAGGAAGSAGAGGGSSTLYPLAPRWGFRSVISVRP
jgi:hypothetical protein